MTNTRKVVLANNQIYHIFNRAIDRQTIFTTKWEYKRAIDTLKYYLYSNLQCKFSQFLNQTKDHKLKILQEQIEKDQKLVEIISFCFMPNHFHFLVKQLRENGISKFVANFTNSYTKYFNSKHQRNGHLFEGTFKAILVESDEQLIHLSRYIHLNPVTSFIVKKENLEKYEWSSFPEFISHDNKNICDKSIILDHFSTVDEYKAFLKNQINYAQTLDKIKHLTMEG